MLSSQSLTQAGIKAHVGRMETDSSLIRSDTLNTADAMRSDASEMPANATLEPLPVEPAKPFHITQVGIKFTPEIARAAALERWKRARAPIPTPEPKNVTTATQDVFAGSLSGKEREKLVRDYKELARISMDNLKSLTDPKDRHQEASTLAKINQALWRYSQIPGEGTFKPTTAKPRDRRMDNLGPVG